MEVVIIVVDHVHQGCEPTVVVEATLVDFVHIPERAQGHGPIAVIRRTPGLKLIDTDLLPRVQAPAWLCEERRYVTGGAPRFAIEKTASPRRHRRVETARGGFWHGQ